MHCVIFELRFPNLYLLLFNANYQYGVPQGTIHEPLLFQNKYEMTLSTKNSNIARKYIIHCTGVTKNDKRC